MRHRLVVCVGLVALGVLPPACSSSKSAPAPGVGPAAPAPPAPALWGDLKPVVSVKELMHDMIDPASDFIFDSVSTQITKKGTVDVEPKTQADWDKVRFGAVTLAEGAYLLKIPRPFTPPGVDNNSGGPEPLELSAAEIKAKLEKDPVLWNAKIEALRNVGLEVLEIVKKKDVKELWDASDNLDQACENCHLEYWYPSQKALLDRLDRQLKDLYPVRPQRTGKIGMDPKK